MNQSRCQNDYLLRNRAYLRVLRKSANLFCENSIVTPTKIFCKIIGLETVMNNAIAANIMALELLSDPFLKIFQFINFKTTNQSDNNLQ